MYSSSAIDMDKHTLRQLIVARLAEDFDVLQRAAQTAYETATHEENVAENKYDTLGLEASYLATGQARRMEEIRQALGLFQQLTLRDYDPARGIQVGALVTLEAMDGTLQWLFLGPEAAGLKVRLAECLVTVITPRSPLGQALLGKFEDDDVAIVVAGMQQTFTVTHVR